MSTYRSRDYSPPRHYGDQHRATTGNVYVTSFDTTSRAGSAPQPRASVSSVSSGRSSVAYQAQPMRKSTLADGKTKTEYVVRPRHDSFNPVDSKQPLSVSTRRNSPPRYNSVLVSSPRVTSPTAMHEDSGRYLQPASSHGHRHGFQQQRHNSTSISDLESRKAVGDKRDRSYHPRQVPYVQKVYHENRQPPLREEDQWSYTGPREQFDRDYPQRPPQKENGIRRERPIHRLEPDRAAHGRGPVPPPSMDRQLVRHNRTEPERHVRRSGFDSDPDRGSEMPKRRNSTRQPVVHQHLMRDDGYSSARDDRDSRTQSKHRVSRYDDRPNPRDRPRGSSRERPRENPLKDRNIAEVPEQSSAYERNYHRDDGKSRHRHHERDYERQDRAQNERRKPRSREHTPDRSGFNDDRRKPRSREHSPERSGLKGLATGALGSIAAVGAVKGLSREHRTEEAGPEDDDERSRRHLKHRHRSEKDDHLDRDGAGIDRRNGDSKQARVPESSSSDNPDGEVSRRRRSRRRREEDDAAMDEKTSSANEQNGRRGSRVRKRDRVPQPLPDTDQESRELVPFRRHSQEQEVFDGRPISPGDNDDDRPRRVQLVEPVNEKEDVKPKGILKPARQVPFPEDPNPIREGVAPLKDATKDGVPPNARWTKISRVLVNPEALEKAQERFEERDDYVIVLRVVDKDEVKILADKTREIRAAREREWQQKLEQQKHLQIENGGDARHSDGEINYDHDNEGAQSQLAIEPGPPAPPVNLQNLQSAAPEQSAQPRGTMAGIPGADINVEASYSQNV